MAEKLLIVATATLFGWSLALAGFTIAMRAWGIERQRRWRRKEDLWRGPIEAFVLDGSPVPPVPRPERDVVLELLLRYLSLLRGDEAQRIIAYLETEGYVERAVQRLDDRSRWRRAEAAGQLGRIRSHQAVPTLIGALHDRSEDVRTVAARSLAAIGHPEAVAALAAALGDRSRWTASAVAADLIEMGSFAVPTLLEIAAGKAHDAAVSAIRVLGETRDGRAAAPLAEILRSSADLNMRAQAACALGKIGSLQSVDRLKSALADREWQVRAQAATALGALGDPESVAALATAIEDESWWVRRNCAEALGRLGSQGRQALLQLSASPDRYVRERCLAALEGLNAPATDRQVSQVPQ